jgi:acetyl-CoA carboxylase biotin carboxyl carrier protein
VSLKSKIDNIIESLKDTNISEIEISSFWGAQKIRLKTSLFNDTPSETHYKKDNQTNNESNTDSEKTVITESLDIDTKLENNFNDNSVDENSTVIKAPLVGTFYASSKPGEPSFVEKGKVIQRGDPLCIVEAMKIFNTIESEYSGEILDILVNDGEPVEFGQELFLIKEIDV